MSISNDQVVLVQMHHFVEPNLFGLISFDLMGTVAYKKILGGQQRKKKVKKAKIGSPFHRCRLGTHLFSA